MSKQRFGPPNGPYLDIYNYSDIKSTPITLEDAATAIYSSNNSNWGKVAQVLPAHLAKSVKEGRCKTIVGHVEGHMLIALNYKRGTEAGNALRLIEKHEERALPPTIVAALLTAVKARNANPAPTIFAKYARQAGAGKLDRPMSDAQIEQLVDNWISETLSGQFAQVPLGSVNRAKMILAVAKRLWRTDIASRCGKAVVPSAVDGQIPSSFIIMATLAQGHRLLQNKEHVKIANMSLNVKNEIEIWLQFIELVSRGISKQALTFLCNKSWPASNENFIWFDDLPAALQAAPQVDDVPSAKAWSQSLIRDAMENAAYVPAGGFALTFPSNYPLREWGLPGLRIHADPEGLWVSTKLNSGENLFRWEPSGLGINPVLIPHELAPLMDVTLAALWRDLVTCGETVIREVKPRRNRKAQNHQKKPTGKVKTLHLPRKRIVFRGERRQWGTDEEQELITHRRHSVKAHFRRLTDQMKASDKAKENAREYGYTVLPDGFTFVLPHVRGHGEEVNKPTTVVVAQGLQAATTFLNK